MNWKLKNSPRNCFVFITLLIGLFPTISCAFTVNADYVGEQLKWKNATVSGVGDWWTSTDWTPVSGMPPTTTWIPGNFATKPPSTMQLSGPGGTASLPIVMNGIEFNWSSASPTAANAVSTGVPVCSHDSVGANSGYEANSDGTPCVSKNQIQNGTAVTPFYFIRPIFNIDTVDLKQALEGKESGTYSGTIPLSIRYYYMTSGGALSYFILSQSFTFIINYQPAILTDVLIIGDQNITPQYNTDNNTVSGSTSFNVIATGMFPNGITLTFVNRDYNMTDMNSDKYIPYSITCNACVDNQIVLNGIYQLASTETSVPSPGDINLINFNLDVSYNDISKDTITTGTYSDTFTIIFKETL